MDYNYHTHTYRCGHASGTIEDYINRSIACGIKVIGFSDHMPYVCEDGYEISYRVPVAQAREYVSEIASIREKYTGQIDIHIGFEMEYYPEKFEVMLDNAIQYGAEYLILGQHYNQEEHPGGVHAIHPTDSIEDLKEYVECVVEAMRTGVFTYVAHPDLINYTGDKEIYRLEMRKICTASRVYNIPLEINFLGIRDHRNYPNDIFWELAGEEKAPVTFGFDAHDVNNAFDSASLIKAVEMAKKYGLNYIGKPKLVILRNNTL